MATSVARLTVASSTPGVLPRKRSIRLTQEAHVIPTTGSWISVGAAGSRAAVGVVIWIPGGV